MGFVSASRLAGVLAVPHAIQRDFIPPKAYLHITWTADFLSLPEPGSQPESLLNRPGIIQPRSFMSRANSSWVDTRRLIC